MRAVVYEKYGPPEVLKLRDVEKPVPKDNEILIRLFATTVTSGDVRMRKADPAIVRLFNGFFTPKRNILGVEFSGVVESAGMNVKLFRKGEQVFGSTGFNSGTYAEYRCIPEEEVVSLKPSNISFEEAAAVPFGGLTSLHFLRKGDIRRGQKVLIYGASGSLGTAAVQLAKHFGSEVTAVCSMANKELIKSLGADKVIDYTKEDFTNNSEEYDIIYDTIGKSPFSGSIKSLKKNGFFLRAVNIDPASLTKGLWANMTSGRKVVGGVSVENKENLIFLKDLIETGKYKPVIDRSYTLEQIAEAHKYVETGHKKGNVVITIS